MPLYHKPIGIAAGSAPVTNGNITFSNSNGISFYLAPNSIMTASHNGLTTARASNDAIGLNTALTAGPLLVSANSSGLSIDASGVAGVGTSATNATFTLNSNGLALSVNAGGAAAPLSTYVPYYPASTGVQTMGAQGVTSASAFFWPVSVVNPVAFNRIEQLMTASWVSSSISGQGTVTHNFGIFSVNGGTALNLISSNSYSFALTCSSISATLSAPVSYGTAGGYTYTTFAASSTATAQSLFGTAGNRIMTWGFGDTMSLSEGMYVLGVHQRMSSSSANVGINFGLAGNVMGAAQSAGPIGYSTVAFSLSGAHKWPWGVATSTGAAGYGGSQLPSTVAITNMAKTLTIMPMATFVSR